MIATHAVPMTTATDLAKRQVWVEEAFTTAATLPLSYELTSTMIALWRRAADPLLYGDYYPRIKFLRSDKAWAAWQFEQPERGHGFLQAIRLPAAPQADFTFYPQGIDPAANSRFENAEIGETRALSGSDLHRDGFPVTLPARSGVIWFYQRTNR